TERPVHAVPVHRSRFEIEIAEPVALAGPHVRASAHDAHPPLPAEGLSGRRRVRLFEIVREPVVVVFGARVALALARARPAHDFRRAVAIFEIELWFVLAEIGRR